MLCSVGKSNSNWLDRLRSSRGFPAAGDLSLDHFLSTNPSSNSSNSNLSGSAQPDVNPVQKRDPPPPPPPAKITTGDDDGEKEWFGIMTNVLSELFNMGDSDSGENPTFSRKKSSRKQTNPRICVLPNSPDGIESERFDGRGDEGVAAAVTRNEENLTGNEEEEEGEADGLDGEEDDEKCNGGGDLLSLGYSKSEVTVIDTSCGSWKFDKLLFRKLNVWKVRDKKERPRNAGRKRKVIPSEEGGAGGKKIAKDSMTISPFNDEDNGTNCAAAPLNEGGNPQNDNREETFQETPNIFGQVPGKRFSFPRSARKKTKGGGTSAIHMKGAREVRELNLEAGIQHRRRMG